MSWMTDALARNGFALKEAMWSPNDPDQGPDRLGNWPAYYRKLTQSNERDLDPLDQDRMIQIALYLYETNPLARRILEITVDFVVGEGLTFTAGDERVQAVLDDFWTDPINAWPTKQEMRFRQLLLFGEQCWPVFRRKADGRIRLGYVDPEHIRRVEVNPDNAEEYVAIHLKAGPGRTLGPAIPIIHVDDNPRSDAYGLMVAGKKLPADEAGPYGTFYVAINHVSNSARGRSELLTAFDWLDLYDQFLFSQAERAAYLSDFLWDVELQGYTEEQIKEWLRHNKTPQGNAMRAHNEKVTWDAKAPELRAGDVKEFARTIRQQIVTGAGGFPEHWIFAGDETNFATAAAQGTPIMKHLSRRQREWKAVVQQVLDFVRDQAILARRLPRDLTPEQRAIAVNASEVSTEDLVSVATTLKAATEAMVVAQDRGWVTQDEAAQVYRRLATELGVVLKGGVPVDELGDVIDNETIQETRRFYHRIWTQLPVEERARLLAVGSNGEGNSA